MAKVRIISDINYFFNFNFKKMISMSVIGFVFSLITIFLTVIFPFDRVVSYRMSLILASVIVFLIMALKNYGREMILVLFLPILIWNLFKFGWILVPVCIFLFVFFEWIMQITKFKDYFPILLISALMLKILIEVFW